MLDPDPDGTAPAAVVSSPEPTTPRDDPRCEVAPGLFTPHHRDQLGPALHAYLTFVYQVQHRSPTYPWLGGRDPKTQRPMLHTCDLLGAVHGVSERTMRDWLGRMVRGGYVVVEVVNTKRERGIRIRILKAKFWRRGQMKLVPDPPPTPRKKDVRGPRKTCSGGSPAEYCSAAACEAASPEDKDSPHRYKKK